jgi:hypothetical protein
VVLDSSSEEELNVAFRRVECRKLENEGKKSKLWRTKMGFGLPGNEVLWEMDVLIDSGTSHSSINSKMVPKDVMEMLEKHKLSRKIKLEMESVFETKKARAVSAEMGVRVGSWGGDMKFIITDLLQTEEAILGLDFIEKFSVVLNGSNRTVTIGGEESDIGLVTRQVVIPPFHEAVVNVQTKRSKFFELNKLGIFEPSDFSKKGLIFARSLNKMGETGLKVTACNLSDQPVTFKKGTLVGRVSAISETVEVDREQKKK